MEKELAEESELRFNGLRILGAKFQDAGTRFSSPYGLILKIQGGVVF